MAVLSGAEPAVALEEDRGSDAGIQTAGAPSDVLVDAHPKEIRADGYSHSSITGTVRDASWNPVPGAFVAFTTTLGTISPYCYAEAEGSAVTRSPSDWVIESYSGASGGQYARSCGTAHPDASLSWTFNATAISLLYVKNFDGGVAEVQVDGSTAITVDMYAPAQTAAERVVIAGLSAGPHVVTVRYLTRSPVGMGTCIRIDAFRCGVTTDVNGNATATLTSIELSCGSEQAIVTAFAGDPTIPNMLTDTEVVTMTASVPDSIAVVATPDQITANGSSTSVVEATVRDQFGELVPDCTMVSFVATDENSAPPPGAAWVTLPYELVEGEDPTEVITDGWSIDSDVNHHGGEAIYSNTPEAAASWNFTGTAVSLIYARSPDAGVASIAVDSGLPITIDMYAPSPQYQVEHVITHGLSYGSHFITVTVAGYTATGGTDTRVYVDALRSGTSTSGGTATAIATAGTQPGVTTVEAIAVGRPCCDMDGVVTGTVPITLTAGDPYTLTLTPTDISITCCMTTTLQFTVTDQYGHIVGEVVPRSLTVGFASNPYGDFTPSSVVITQGVGSVEFHGYEAGSGAITGTVQGYGVVATSTLAVAPSTCDALTIAADRTWIYVTDTNTSLLTNFPYTATITAELRDSCGNPVQDGTVVTFTTTAGSVSPASSTTVNGVATTTLTSGQLGPGVPTMVAYVAAEAAGCLPDATDVTFRRHVHTLSLTANPDEMGIGGNTSNLTAYVYDGAGAPSPDGVMVGFTITPPIRASVPYEFVEGEDATEVTRGGGGWSEDSNASHHGGKAISSSTAGDTASWDFTGPAVSLMHYRCTSCGVATVTVDSTVVVTVDMYAPTTHYQVERVIANNLSPGPHVVTVTVAGYKNPASSGTTVNVDAFRSGTTTLGGMAAALATSGTEAGLATIEAAAIGSTITDTAQLTIMAGDPYTLTITPTDVSLTCCVTTTLQFTVTDQYGNIVGAVVPRSLTVGFDSTPEGDFTPPNAVITQGVGSVEFHGYEAGTGSIEGHVAGFAAQAWDTVNLAVSVGPPGILEVTREPSTILADGLDYSIITATVRDSCGNPVCNSVVTFTADSGSFAPPPTITLSLTKTTDYNGVATATLRSICSARRVNITATVDSLTETTYVDMVGVAWDVQLTANPTTIPVGGHTSHLTATVNDQFGHAVVDGTVVTFTTSSGYLGSDTIAKTTTGGIATAVLTSSNNAGPAIITATAGSGIDRASDTVTVTFEAGPPYTVTLQANPTSMPVGGYTAVLTATLVDQYNNNVTDGTVVTFTTSLGSLGSDLLTRTTLNGIATAVLTSEATAGTAVVTVTADSKVATTTVEFTPLQPYTLTLAAHPTDLTVGETSALTATVVDQYANRVADGTPVTFTTNLGSVGSATITRDTINGVATATLTSQVAGTATVTATSGSASETVDVTFNPGPPYTVTLTADPTSILVGGYTSTLTVTVTDELNNHVTDGTVVTFETSLGTFDGGTVTRTTASGVATATLTSGNIAGVAVVTATVDSKIATTTVTFTPDIPYTITLAAYPTSLTVEDTSTLTATVTDQYNNHVADGTVVTFTTSLGSLDAVTKTTTNGVAIATLASQLPGTAIVTATADSKVATTTVEFQPGRPYTVTLLAYPTALTVGNTSALTATVKDLYNNNVADGTVVTFTTSLGDMGSQLVTKMTADGVATATLTSQVAGTALVTATADSKYGTASVTFEPDLPYTVTVEANPASIPIGWFTSTITAVVEDQHGNMVADGTEVTITTDLGSLGSNSVVKTTINGVAQATLTSGLTIGTAHITATSGSAVGHTQVTFTVGAPYTVTVESWPPTIEVGGSTATITATVTDIGGYAVADGTPVVFTTDLGSLGSDTVTKYTINGVATATLTSPLTPGVATITATAGSKSGTTIVKFAPGPPDSIEIVAAPPYIPIGGATSLITATVKDRYGNNVVNGTNVDFITTLGTVSPPSASTIDGIAVTTLTSGMIVGTARVTAVSGSVEDWVDVVFTVGPPFYISVVANPASIGLNGQTSNIEATVRDIGGNNVADGTPVTFTTSLGSLGSDTVIKYTTSGVATAVLTSGTTAGTAIITATADSKYSVTQVVIVPDPPYTVTLTADPVAIPANGVSTSMLTAMVTDQYGNPVADGTPVTFTTNLGTLDGSSSIVRFTTGGVATAILTSSRTDGLATVTAVCGGRENQIHVYFYRYAFQVYLPMLFKPE